MSVNPADARDVVAVFMRAAHLDENQNMVAAWALLGGRAQERLQARFVEANHDTFVNAVLGVIDPDEAWSAFADWLRPILRDLVPLPRFDPEPYDCSAGWEAGMSHIQIAEPDGDPFFAFLLERVEPQPDAPDWPWRVHSFAPLAAEVPA